MKRLLSLFCALIALTLTSSPSISEEKGSKPKPPPRQAVLVKNDAPLKYRATKASPRVAKPAPAKNSSVPKAAEESAVKTAPIPATETMTATILPPAITPSEAAPSARSEAVAVPLTPVIVIAPILPPSGNPYLQNVVARPVFAQQPPPNFFPAFGSPYESLKATLAAFLPEGIGQMHPPIYLKFIDQGPNRSMLLFQISCPTKALIGIDTPIIAVLQLGVDQVIALVNSTNLLPIEFQKVCS